MKLEITLSAEEMVDIVKAETIRRFPAFDGDAYEINVLPASYSSGNWTVNIDEAEKE